MKPRRRTIFKAAPLFLLIGGATLNVAVAWASSALSDVDGSRSGAPVRDSAWLALMTKDAMTFQHASGFGYEEFYVGTWSPESDDDGVFGWSSSVPLPWDPPLPASILRSGWPQKSMLVNLHITGEELRSGRKRSRLATLSAEGLVIGSVGRRLPLTPFWPGFAINTLFYAGVLWVLFAGPFALRRMIRRRRGQCAHCAYPIGINNVCTECGAAVTKASRDQGIETSRGPA